jgi:hypothetical protein
MSSNVGSASVYEAGDQRTVSDAEIQQEQKENRFHEGKDNSHKAQDSSTFPPLTLLPSYFPTLLSNPPSTHIIETYEHILILFAEDERSIANKLEREAKRENEGEEKSLEDRQREQDATLPARAHGNEPSKGAKIDQELREEEEAELKRKGKA